MNSTIEIIQQAVEKAENSGISIQYTPQENHFNLTISSPTGDAGQRNYIFQHIPYTDLDGIDEAALVKRFQQFAKHEIGMIFCGVYNTIVRLIFTI